ncbi:hypothetical protein [Methylobacterium oryzihabitans]|uniref:Uncharacterized protein n=1 Tax=Methylobacterium oryzihabitans TaxID=2499852 RepID=A0A437PA51_9HYPH|nr:hypothetical protein [Methylobacterium oryzihabitans]RVU19135.1 hypothetical protein EOE48_09610 [Methylobacterium oryzihabitans]
MNEFVSDIELDFPPGISTVPFGDEHYIEFRLGFLPETRRIVIMSIILMEGGSALHSSSGVFDLRFGIRLKYMDKDWDVTPVDFSQETKRDFIHPNHRETVLNLIMRGVCELVTEVNPPLITMSTYDTELPPQALVKYAAIAECLNGLGYRTADAYLSADGRHRWVFAPTS